MSDVRPPAAPVSVGRPAAASVSDTRPDAAPVSVVRPAAVSMSDARPAAAPVSDVRPAAAPLRDVSPAAATAALSPQAATVSVLLVLLRRNGINCRTPVCTRV